jgi:hypothetical protein
LSTLKVVNATFIAVTNPASAMPLGSKKRIGDGGGAFHKFEAEGEPDCQPSTAFGVEAVSTTPSTLTGDRQGTWLTSLFHK